MSTPKEILSSAISVIDQRAMEYGDAGKSFGTISELWDAYLSSKNYNSKLDWLTPVDVAHMMIIMKISRNSILKEDNLVDICGYAALIAELGEFGSEGVE